MCLIVHNSEHMCVAAYRRQRTHQIDMDMGLGETSRRHVNALNRRLHMSTLVLWQSRQLRAQALSSLFMPGHKNLNASRRWEPLIPG